MLQFKHTTRKQNVGSSGLPTYSLIRHDVRVRFVQVLFWAGVVFVGAVACGNNSKNEIKLASDNVSVDELPLFVHFEKPVYPQLVYLAMVEDVVWVEMLVGINGFPREVVVVQDRWNNEEFRKSAVEAGEKCTFSPALKDGKPIEVRIRFAFEFRISPEDRRKDAIRRRMGG